MHDVISVALTVATIIAAAFFINASVNGLRTELRADMNSLRSEIMGRLGSIQKDMREF